MAYKPLTIEFRFRNKRWSDAEKGLRAVGKHLEGSLDRASNAMAKEMRTFLEGVAEALARRHGNPWPGGTSEKTLSIRSGAGLASIRESIKIVGSKINDLEGHIGGNFYMGVHERGKTIKAKNAKYLTIPLPAALNSNGTPKKRSAREWDNTFVGESKAGNLLIFQKTGSGIIPLYALKKQVKIPPRLGMGETIRAGLPYFVDKAFDAMLYDMLTGPVKG